jgi:transposase-like protein
MTKKARNFGVEFKREAVRRMAEATTIVGLAEKLGVRRKLLYQWRDQLKVACIAKIYGSGGSGTFEKPFPSPV